MSGDTLKGFFTTGPDDSLGVVDVYKRKVAETAYTSAATVADQAGVSAEPLKDLASNDLVQEGADLLDKVVELGSADTGCTKKVSNERISEVVPGGNVNTGKLCQNTAKSLLESIQELDLTNLGSIRDVTGTAIRVAERVEATEVQRIVDLAKDFTRDASIVKVQDLAASMGLRHTLIQEGIELGITEIIPSLLAKKDELQVDGILDVAEKALTRGDYRMISTLANELGRHVILARYPDAIPVLLSAFRIPGSYGTENYEALMVEFKTALESIDPNWMHFTRNGEVITNLEYFDYANHDARTILSLHPEFKVPLMVVKSYRFKDIRELVMENLPLLAL